MQMIDASKAVISVNGQRIEAFDSVQIEVDLCKCGQESDYGCHGVTENEVYSLYRCEECYNRDKRRAARG